MIIEGQGQVAAARRQEVSHHGAAILVHVVDRLQAGLGAPADLHGLGALLHTEGLK